MNIWLLDANLNFISFFIPIIKNKKQSFGIVLVFYKSKEDIKQINIVIRLLFYFLYYTTRVYVYQRTAKNEDWISERELFPTLDILKRIFGLGNW